MTPTTTPNDVHLTVVGSVNVDLVARVRRIPRAGETLSANQCDRYPGGKGANQAVAAALLGASVRFHGAVGQDGLGDFALSGMRRAGVSTNVTEAEAKSTGVAMILVSDDGDTQIVIAEGANAATVPTSPTGPVLCQLEIPDEAVFAAAEHSDFFALNAAPARPIELEPDLLVVNRFEHQVCKRGRHVAVTNGAEDAVLYDGRREIARVRPPAVQAVDGTAAGDAFTACLVVSLLEGRAPEVALRRACAAGALTTTRVGAQPSLPTREQVDRLVETQWL